MRTVEEIRADYADLESELKLLKEKIDYEKSMLNNIFHLIENSNEINVEFHKDILNLLDKHDSKIEDIGDCLAYTKVHAINSLERDVEKLRDVAVKEEMIPKYKAVYNKASIIQRDSRYIQRKASEKLELLLEKAKKCCLEE